MIFKRDHNISYDVVIGKNSEHGLPHIIGGTPVEDVTLKVIAKLED